MASKIAHFPTVRDLSGFDFSAQPSLDPGQIRDLAVCRWIAHGDTLLLLGPSGVGKTPLAIALGREAIREGYSAALGKAHQEGRFEERLAFYAKPKLLIVDELGYLPFDPNAAHLFFQLVSRRYERGSLLITSNRSVGEWGEVFGDPVVAPASTGCSITAMSSPSAATATACARSAVPVFSTQPTSTWRRLITHDSRQICAPACRHPGAHRYLPRSAPPAAWRRSATRGSLLWTPAPSHTPSTKGGRFYRGVTSGCRLIRMGRARSRTPRRQ